MSSASLKADAYEKVSQREHVLLRPDSYVGSNEIHEEDMWLVEEPSPGEGGEEAVSPQAFVRQTVQHLPALRKIFDEILVNAADNRQRDSNMDTLKVDIDPESGQMQVFNNGKGLPVEIHPKEKIYVPELVFGHLLTSSNYRDEEEKVTGGRNGFGAKLANIFSSLFTVETYDGKHVYKQTWSDNMTKCGKAKITKGKKVYKSSKQEYTKITFVPDWKQFRMDGLSDDMFRILKKRVYDIAGCNATNKLKVWFNGKQVAFASFHAYCQWYLQAQEPTNVKEVKSVYEKVKENDRWEVVVCPNPSNREVPFQMSFVNSITTYQGGVHVDHARKEMESQLLPFLKKQPAMKGVNVTPGQLRNCYWIFVNSLITNPSFDSQSKEKMTSLVSKLGSKCVYSEAFFKKVQKVGVVEQVVEWVQGKKRGDLKKHDGVKKQRIFGIPKLEDANRAGTNDSRKCTLILTEGDSAKALAVSGLSVVKREYYGVFPLRGKFLNVRDASHKQLMENAELLNLKKIIGLRAHQTYTPETISQLRYGHIMIMADQDHDGSHIKGLVLNFFAHMWPSLLRVDGFLQEFVTPITKAISVTHKNVAPQVFFTLQEFRAWAEKEGERSGQSQQGIAKKWTVKYYKGLGTSTAAEAKEYFSDLGRHKLQFTCDENALQSMGLAFQKDQADQRKTWLTNMDHGAVVDHTQSRLSITDFVNKELVHFSNADNVRSIPSVIDGMKPGQRKILYSCFKRKLTKEIKVAQLAGYVSEHSAYHHGEEALAQTIVNLAQDFVGSNNLNLLYPGGQFGTRAEGGKNSASPRYIFTRLQEYTRSLFMEEDDPILEYLEEDGESIEPEYYVPVLPLLLMNGAEGIGTGWSTKIPSFHPLDIARAVQEEVRNPPSAQSSDTDTDTTSSSWYASFGMQPWYRGFEGTICPSPKPQQFISYGTAYFGNGKRTVLHITELPVGQWTQNYKEFLEKLLLGNGGPKAATGDVSPGRETSTTKATKETTKGSKGSKGTKGTQSTKAAKPTKASAADGVIKGYKEHHTDTRVHFEIELTEHGTRLCSTEDGVYDTFKLTSKIHASNMMAFNAQNRMQKYVSPREMIREFVQVRLSHYQKRKAHFVAKYEKELVRISNKVRFIMAVLDGTLVLHNVPKAKIVRVLSEMKFEQENKSFDYLLGMPLWSLTKERVDDLLQEEKDKGLQLEQLRAQTHHDLYLGDLKRVEQVIADVLGKDENTDPSKPKPGFWTLVPTPQAPQPGERAAPSSKKTSSTVTERAGGSSKAAKISQFFSPSSAEQTTRDRNQRKGHAPTMISAQEGTLVSSRKTTSGNTRKEKPETQMRVLPPTNASIRRSAKKNSQRKQKSKGWESESEQSGSSSDSERDPEVEEEEEEAFVIHKSKHPPSRDVAHPSQTKKKRMEEKMDEESDGDRKIESDEESGEESDEESGEESDEESGEESDEEERNEEDFVPRRRASRPSRSKSFPRVTQKEEKRKEEEGEEEEEEDTFRSRLLKRRQTGKDSVPSPPPPKRKKYIPKRIIDEDDEESD